MGWAQWITVAGLVMTVLGAVIAANDLKVLPFALLPEVKAAQRHRIAVVDSSRRKGYVSPPYTQEQVSQALQLADDALADDLAEVQEDENRALRDVSGSRYMAARNGLLLVAVGSVAQILGVVGAA
ncbi:hypothetical protein [Ornithinimicrobium murale]|uniref:hypothetical protein n=1 Tax=Ornithinimicrobium murale TaxID=1050153 RepID=UPI0013B3DF90|nr:hypothetical protein [Ornithinimicrobium murale]